MKLSDLISQLPPALVGPADLHAQGITVDPEVTRVTSDSREVGPGVVFVAVKGRSVDGHEFIEAAVAAGAAAVVSERPVEAAVPVVVVANSEAVLGHLIASVMERPGDRLTLIGITGTNGKTTTTYLVESILAAAGTEPGVIGTVSYRYGGKSIDAPYTTPTPAVLHQTFAEMHKASVTHAVLEVSSAALEMHRLSGVAFRVAAFTNLTQDHLDVHGTMEAYRDAKALLFRNHLAADGVAVVNVDDPFGSFMAAAADKHKVCRVSTHADAEAEVRVLSAESSVAGITARIMTPRGALVVASSKLIGGYNVANLALAVAIADALEIPHEAITRGIADMPGVPGRVERVENDAGLDVLVDYAHTADALTNVLGALRPLTARRLICVFGCGGDRDPTKRPRMGAAVHAAADLCIVTSDNPRTEDPQRIIDMIVPAVPDAFLIDVDRRRAIVAAIAEATPGDVVLIAGKGHEDYQILGKTKVHFDDREEAANAIAGRRRWTVDDIINATGATVEGTEAQLKEAVFSRLTIDGRQATQGDIYVAIAGERFDGHRFTKQAVVAGAGAVIVANGKDIDAGDAIVFRVEDPRAALGMLARHVRRDWAAAGGKTLVAITGSAGKTTTKELVRAVLASQGHPLASRGSLNNETGVPLTMLGLLPIHDTAVIEMGMRGAGQIDYLCDFAEPDVSVVVNAGTAHIELLGSTDAIAAAKGEIFARLPAAGVAVYPADDARLAKHAEGHGKSLTFGADDRADVALLHYRSTSPNQSELAFKIAGVTRAVRVPFIGRHNAINAACAVAVGIATGMRADAAIDALANAHLPAMRSEVVELADRHVIVDCYNANPASMAAALETLDEIRGARPAVAVVGDMLELGDEAKSAHHEVGADAARRGIAVIALGTFRDTVVAGASTVAGATAKAYDEPAEAAAAALSMTGSGDWILVKASRGMRLERVVEALSEESR